MNIQFASFNEILAMGGHGLYVWVAVTVSVAVLAALLVVPWAESYTRSQSGAFATRKACRWVGRRGG